MTHNAAQTAPAQADPRDHPQEHPLDPAQARVDAYVRAALELQGYQLDAAQTAAVALQFARIALIAGTFIDDASPLDSGQLPVFRP